MKKETRDNVFAADLLQLIYTGIKQKERHDINGLEATENAIGALFKKFRESVLEDTDERV